ncbi:MAG: ATP-binding cassette domain-containing protein [Planctomycetes bacterium]|nr:ATP-binding cassette domain-containing protein [Planctomycetota bacterium]
MIEVKDLTKWYGRTLALDRATFAVQEGQIVGFLGPNGAGKTTALRILTGYLPATSGEARVAGRDVLMESLAVRAGIGYMPENVPLYMEMRVQEYLRFRAGLKGVPAKNRAAAVERVVERCWLKDMRRRLIGQLSKGFRQRVGLAEALVADPKVLILDEPTIGLDPAQIQETRRLIRQLGEKHTILLSSHILPEVERTCSHLVIIASGRIAATGSLEELKKGLTQGQRVILEVAPGKTGDGPAEMARALGQAAGAADVAREDAGDGWTRLRVSPAPGADPRAALYAAVAGRGWLLREMHTTAPTLEELYVQITAGDQAVPAARSTAA